MKNRRSPDELVLDISASQGKRGFRGSEEWWSFVRSQDERQRLDHLFGVALLDANVRHRLVDVRDDTLLTDFGLSEATKRWIITMQATSLTDMAREVANNFRISA